MELFDSTLVLFDDYNESSLYKTLVKDIRFCNFKNNLDLKSIPFDNMPSFTFGYIKLNSTSLNQMHYDFLNMLRNKIGI